MFVHKTTALKCFIEMKIFKKIIKFKINHIFVFYFDPSEKKKKLTCMIFI